MKRHYLYLCCCLCVALLAYSHYAYADGSVKADRNIKGRDSLYLQIYGGINKSANENLPMSGFSS